MKLVRDENAGADYLCWQAQDRKVLRWIKTLISDVVRNGDEGIGKPEPLEDGFQVRIAACVTTTEADLRPRQPAARNSS